MIEERVEEILTWNVSKQGILMFTWNASGLRICETSNQRVADNKRKGILFKKHAGPCKAPDFSKTHIEPVIVEKQPLIVAISTQEEASDETYYHSDYLPRKMKGFGYVQYYREKLEKVGFFAMPDHKQARSEVVTGDPGKTALRLSVYVHQSFYENFKFHRDDIEDLFPATQIYDSRMKNGALACYLGHPQTGIFCIVAAHFPDDYLAAPLDVTKYHRTRARKLRQRHDFLNKISEEFFFNVEGEQRALLNEYNLPPVNYFFVMGDFGFNSTPRNGQNLSSDELHSNELDPPMEEGVSGFNIDPTWPSRGGRVNGTIYGDRDRVLYYDDRGTLECHKYETITTGSIRDSYHTGRLSYFTFSPIPQDLPVEVEVELREIRQGAQRMVV